MYKTMLYKPNGPHKIHGHMLDYTITDDIDAALKDGWFKTTPEAIESINDKAAKSPAKPKEPSDRDNLKSEAAKLGIEHAKNISTVKLKKLVEDKKNELD